MKIRYYLLLVIGLMSTVVFLGSFIYEGLVLQKHISGVRSHGAQLYEEALDKRRGYLEEFIADSLAKNLAQINVVLDAISQFKPLSEWFSPTVEHGQSGTWKNATALIQQDDWIQFLQNTEGSSLLSLVIPEKGPFFSVKIEPFQEGLAWIYILGSNSYPDPFLGVEIPLKSPRQDANVFALEFTPKSYALYQVARLKTAKIPEQLEDSLVEVEEVDEVRFFSFLKKAIALALSPDLIVPKSKVVATGAKKEETGGAYNQELKTYQQEKETYSNELFLLQQLTTLQQTGALGSSKETFWPDAMTIFSTQNEEEGPVAFFIKPIMGFSSPIFDDVSFFAAHPPLTDSSFVSSGSHVVKSSTYNQAFLVNTAAILLEEEGSKKRSLLTIGIDLEGIIDEIVLGFHQYGIILSEGKVVLNKAPSGIPLIANSILEAAFLNDPTSKDGVFFVGGAKYYFFKMQPDPSLDLYFVSLHSDQDEFSFFYAYEEEFSAVAKKILVERRIVQIMSLLILWSLLIHASKKLAKPIVILSNSLTHVKEGHWEDIKLPQVEFKKGNEIRSLYDSFFSMIEGLKEKEKVTAILNKVVSSEIAKEILKGDIKLGGEERVVTMLFADIRGFTHLTQNMPPHEVISFLNKCMTKLSGVVEQHKGVIDKYLGDGLMAIYGAPISYEESPLHAIISGLEMVEVLRGWNLARKENSLSPIYVGVGIHTGSVCAGNMGAQHRLNYTVIGSNVNMASRLCASAEAEEVLITEFTYLQPSVKENVVVQDMGERNFKGFDEKVRVYKVLSIKKGLF